jgi:predicted transposase/invertase (TIGR01784 family)
MFLFRPWTTTSSRVVITNYILKPEEEDYLNVYEPRNQKTGRLFTDLQKYVTIELPKLPENDDGHPAWPQLQFLKSHAKEDMELLTKKHPEMRSVVADYNRMTLLERFRKRAEAREKERRDTWAALEYAKDEGRNEGLEEGRNEGRATERNQILELIDQGYTMEQLKAKLNEDSRPRG